MKTLIILGAGGHAAVVAESAERMNKWAKICFLDDQFPDVREVLGYSVVDTSTNDTSHISSGTEFVSGIGDNRRRREFQEAVAAVGGAIATVIDPGAIISQSATIGTGCAILPGAIVNARCRIGEGTIINSGATVDHDCVVGNAVHVSPGAHIAGGVTIGEYSWIGIGATVNECIEIGADVVVGASAAIVESVSSGCVVVGVPAKRVVSY